MLFYRRDKLAESGFTSPPATWDELAAQAGAVMRDAGMPYGLVFQGAAYEGGTANAAEFICSAGGEVMTTRIAITGLVVNAVTEIDSVKLGTEAAASGLAIARRLITDGIAPAAVADFREQEALDAFMSGLLPVLEGLYDESDLLRAIPVMAVGKELFESQLHARPMSPFYSEVSASITGAFQRVLNGELTGTEATGLLESELRSIAMRNRWREASGSALFIPRPPAAVSTPPLRRP